MNYIDGYFNNVNISGQFDIQPRGLEVTVNSRSNYLAVDVGTTKNFLRVKQEKDDALIEGLIRSSTQKVEKYINDFVLTTNATLYWSFVVNHVHLGFSNPVLSNVTSIDMDNVETVLTAGASNDYVLLGNKYKMIRFLNLDATQVKVTGTFGLFSAPSSVDETIKTAILHTVKLLYRNDSGATPDGVLIDDTGLPIQARLLLADYIKYGN